MPRRRFEKLEPERQEAILAAAAEEFVARGYAAASLNRIVERSGISKGALYYYFEDKADLFAAVVDEAVTRALEAVGWEDPAHHTAEDYWERWRALTTRSLELLRSGAWYGRVMQAYPRFQAEPAAAAALGPVADRSVELMRALLERGRELGVVRADVPLDMLVELVRAVGGAGGRWIMERWDGLTESERQELLEARLDLTRDMLDAKHVGWGR
jgi:AcrR family transcriptional regulator